MQIITFAGQPLAYEYPENRQGFDGFWRDIRCDHGGWCDHVLSWSFWPPFLQVSAFRKAPAPWPKVEDADVVFEKTGKKHIGIGGMEAPGTFVLAMILFATIVLYYFINFKYLSTVWGMS